VSEVPRNLDGLVLHDVLLNNSLPGVGAFCLLFGLFIDVRHRDKTIVTRDVGSYLCTPYGKLIDLVCLLHGVEAES
jgi:hypothetical protein